MTTMYKIQDKYATAIIKIAEFTGKVVGTIAKYVAFLVAVCVSLAVGLGAWGAVPFGICVALFGFNSEPATDTGVLAIFAVYAVWMAISVKVYFRLKGIK